MSWIEPDPTSTVAQKNRRNGIHSPGLYDGLGTTGPYMEDSKPKKGGGVDKNEVKWWPSLQGHKRNNITCWWAIWAWGGHCPTWCTTSLEAAFCLNNRAVRVGHALCPYFTGKIISSWSGFYISLAGTKLAVRYSATRSRNYLLISPWARWHNTAI